MKCLECPKQVYVNIGRSTVRSAKTIRKKLATPCVCIFRLPNETLTVCRPRTRGSQLRQQPCPHRKRRAKNPPEQDHCTISSAKTSHKCHTFADAFFRILTSESD